MTDPTIQDAAGHELEVGCRVECGPDLGHVATIDNDRDGAPPRVVVRFDTGEEADFPTRPLGSFHGFEHEPYRCDDLVLRTAERVTLASGLSIGKVQS